MMTDRADSGIPVAAHGLTVMRIPAYHLRITLRYASGDDREERVMASVNVYLPEDLKARFEGADLNLSAIARDCWERELTLAEAPAGEMIRVDAWDGDEEIKLKFQGSLLARSDEDGDLYLSEEDVLVFVPPGEERFWTEPRRDVDGDHLLNWFPHDSDAYAEATAALGLKRVVQL